MNPLKFSLTLLPFLSLVACGSAFEAGNLFPDDAGSTVAEGGRPDGEGYVDAGTTPPHDAGPDNQAPQEAASDAEDASEAAVEASPPPECTAPRCVDGTTVQSCQDGSWGATTACPYVCAAGICGGTCTPGTTSCGASDTQLQTCSSEGAWTTTTCPFACVGSFCSGVCVPETTQICSECANSGTQTCLPNGTWGQCSVGC